MEIAINFIVFDFKLGERDKIYYYFDSDEKLLNVLFDLKTGKRKKTLKHQVFKNWKTSNFKELLIKDVQSAIDLTLEYDP